MSDVARFYDDMAWYYHLLMEDWEASIGRQRTVLGGLLERILGKGDKRIY